MANRLNRRRWAVGLVAVVICLLVAGDLLAKDRKQRGSRDHGQLAVIEAVDVQNRTLTTGGKTYFVPNNANLEDDAGNKVSLSEIHGVDSKTSADLVEIWTRQNGRDGRVEILRLLVKPPMSF